MTVLAPSYQLRYGVDKDYSLNEFNNVKKNDHSCTLDPPKLSCHLFHVPYKIAGQWKTHLFEVNSISVQSIMTVRNMRPRQR